jgi:Helicase associated domain
MRAGSLTRCNLFDRQLSYRDSAPPSSLNEPWQSMFDILCDFKTTHGHCLVLFSYPELGPSVSDRGSQYKLVEVGLPSPLTAERIASLNGIGFTWGRSPDVKWMARYKSLLQYRTALPRALQLFHCSWLGGLGCRTAPRLHAHAGWTYIGNERHANQAFGTCWPCLVLKTARLKFASNSSLALTLRKLKTQRYRMLRTLYHRNYPSRA